MLKETPRVPRSSNTNSNQSQLRSLVAEDMRSEMVVCPWDEFWQHYSPWIPSEAVIQQGVSLLQAAQILNGNEWAEEVDPTAGPNENTGFRSLERIARKLEHVKNDRQASYRLVHKPTQVALSTISSGNHLVDGCFYPMEALPNGPTAPLELRRMASVHEYKPKMDRKCVYDVSLSSLQHHSWLTDVVQEPFESRQCCKLCDEREPRANVYLWGNHDQPYLCSPFPNLHWLQDYNRGEPVHPLVFLTVPFCHV
jgi:hypothetical protein